MRGIAGSRRTRCAIDHFMTLSLLGVAACLSEEELTSDDYSMEQGLATATIQAESMSWTASSGDSLSASSTNMRLQANASGDAFSFTTAVASGTYAVSVRYAKRNLYGNYRVELSGAQIGTLSGYSSSTSDVWSTASVVRAI